MIGVGVSAPELAQRRRLGPSEIDPASLFTGPQKGGFWSCHDTANLFQDAARTTQITAPDQNIEGVADLSGNANHLRLVTAGPLFKTDGAPGALMTTNLGWSLDPVGALDITGTTGVTLFLTLRQDRTTTTEIPFSTGQPFSGGGGFEVVTNNTVNGRIGASLGLGSSAYLIVNADATILPGASYVLGVVFDTTQGGTDKIRLYLGGIDTGVTVVAATGTVTGNISAAGTLKIGSRYTNNTPFHGRLHAAMVIDQALDAGTVAGVSDHLATLAGL